MAKLTESQVRDAPAPATGETVLWDGELRGLGVRIRLSGKRSFILKYRTATGVQRKLKLGTWPALSVDEARRRAKRALGAIEDGKDPAGEKQAEKVAPTVADLAQAYAEATASTKRASSRREDRGLFTGVILPAIGHVKVAAVTRRDVEALHRSRSATPVHANRALALLSNAFARAIAWGWRHDNPAKGIPKFPEERRSQWLRPEQIQRLLGVLAGHPDQRAANFVRLLLLTGARRGEALNATWDQFDLERGIWTKPSHATKQRRTEHVPLSGPAIHLLQGMKAAAPDDALYLFPGAMPNQPYRDPKRFWATVCRQAGISRTRLHDLRHTFVSLMVSSGVPLYIAGRLAGHTQQATTQRYAHLADSPLRAATEHIGAMLTELEQGKGPSSMVS